MGTADSKSTCLEHLLATAESHLGSTKTLVSTSSLIQAETKDGTIVVLTMISKDDAKPLVVVSVVSSPHHDIRSIVLEIPLNAAADDDDDKLISVKKQLAIFLSADSVLPHDPRPDPPRTLNDAPASQTSKIPPLESVPQQGSRRPNDMPDFDDEYETRTPRRSGLNPEAQIDTNDNKDLYPGGVKYPSLKPYLDPTAGATGGSTGGGAVIGGGMMPTPNDRLFGHPKSGGGRIGGVPPGARYDDPYGEEGRDLPGATNTLYGTNIPGDDMNPIGPPGFGGGGSSRGPPGFGGPGGPGGGFGFGGSGSGTGFGRF